MARIGFGHKAYFDKPRPAFNPESYRKWMDGLAYTPAQVADALDAMADRITDKNQFWPNKLRSLAASTRKHNRFSVMTYRNALAELVKSCGVCGKPALYRYGPYGRCRAHKDMLTEGELWRRGLHEAKDRELGAELRERNIGVTARARFHQAMAKRRR